MKKLFLIVTLAIAAYSHSASAQSLAIGGYDVTKIARSTIALLQEKKIITEAEVKDDEGAIAAVRTSDPLVAGVPIVALYEKIGARLVDHRVATADDVAALGKAAAASGGVKVGGVNPMVLAASYLDLLVRKGILPLSEAQSILDSARWH